MRTWLQKCLKSVSMKVMGVTAFEIAMSTLVMHNLYDIFFAIHLGEFLYKERAAEEHE